MKPKVRRRSIMMEGPPPLSTSVPTYSVVEDKLATTPWGDSQLPKYPPSRASRAEDERGAVKKHDSQGGWEGEGGCGLATDD